MKRYSRKLLLGSGLVLSLVVVAGLACGPAAAQDGSRTCHPSYEGACLDTNAGDYDCRGGSGDGPNYTGRIRVVGPDVFGLDRDGNGIGCE